MSICYLKRIIFAQWYGGRNWRLCQRLNADQSGVLIFNMEIWFNTARTNKPYWIDLDKFSLGLTFLVSLLKIHNICKWCQRLNEHQSQEL